MCPILFFGGSSNRSFQSGWKLRRVAGGQQVALDFVLNQATNSAKPAEEVTRATLENGLRVVIVADKLAPVATTVVNYLVGSNETPPGFPGTAHAQEHMMFRRRPGLSAGQLANIAAAMVR